MQDLSWILLTLKEYPKNLNMIINRTQVLSDSVYLDCGLLVFLKWHNFRWKWIKWISRHWSDATKPTYLYRLMDMDQTWNNFISRVNILWTNYLMRWSVMSNLRHVNLRDTIATDSDGQQDNQSVMTQISTVRIFLCKNAYVNTEGLNSLIKWLSYMMTSSNGNIFRVTGSLWVEFPGHRWIPLTKASDAELWFFSLLWAWTTVEWAIATTVIWDVIAPIMMSLEWVSLDATM